MSIRVFQLLPTLAYGDAVSNDAVQMHLVLQKAGYEVRTQALNLHRKMKDAYPFLEKYDGGSASPEEILLYHLSIGSPIHDRIARMDCRKIFRYHNITPPEFFKGFSGTREYSCIRGLREIAALKDVPDLVLADSDFNGEHLRSLGYTVPIRRLPILIPMEDYDRTPDPGILKKYPSGEGHNIIFVGRIAPNKKQQDLIRAFACYREKYDPEARLFLVGGNAGLEHYDGELKRYAKALGIADRVVFTGHIRFDQILAYYRAADAFLSLSEHEGFCVPLLEAMHFDVPVAALSMGAVPETLGEAGLLLPSADPEVVSEGLNRILHMQGAEREQFLSAQRRRLGDYAYEKVAAQFVKEIEGIASVGE